MKFLVLCNDNQNNLIKFLEQKGEVDQITIKLNNEDISKYDWIISYGYNYIISKKIIKKAKNPIINLHISYLPYNRGSYPNYWSFKENTPKGVTIHHIDDGIDTGPVLVQKKIRFQNNETLKTSYEKLKIEVEKLFIESFDDIISNKIEPKKQLHKGTFHQDKDLPKDIDWNISVNKI